MIKKYRSTLILSGLLLSASAHALTIDELAAQFERYKAQQALVFKQLRNENKQLKLKLSNKNKQIENNTIAVNAITDSIEVSSELTGNHWYDNTTFGGYGELHYNTYDSSDVTQVKDEIDFHRFVLFFGHDFTDNLRFFSELELEHSISGDGFKGEIELEQAYLEYDVTDNSALKAGLFLIPIGIINETHEPATFYGVERNDVEKYIIPATWWEAGIGGHYNFDNGINLQLGLSSGLNAADGYIRGGRHKISKQKVNNGAVYGGIKYTGIQGLKLAAHINYQTDLDQGFSQMMQDGILSEFHGIYQYAIGQGLFSTKALYARWDINTTIAGANKQSGWYIEPSYRMPTRIGDVGTYVRYQELSYYKKSTQQFGKWELGFNYWIHENVVLKFDYFEKNSTDKAKQTGIDLGLGYHF